MSLSGKSFLTHLLGENSFRTRNSSVAEAEQAFVQSQESQLRASKRGDGALGESDGVTAGHSCSVVSEPVMQVLKVLTLAVVNDFQDVVDDADLTESERTLFNSLLNKVAAKYAEGSFNGPG